MSRHKEFEREEVLDKALDIFWRNGYNATSFQDLTEGMCISRQSIYDTYGDKHTLFIEALNYYYEKNTTGADAHFAQNLPVKELLKTFIDKSICSASNDKKQKGCMMVNASSELMPDDKDVAVIVNRNLMHITKTVQAAIEKGIRTGQIKNNKEPQLQAMFIVNTIQGLITMAKTITDKKKLQAIADVAIDAVLQ